MFVWTLIAFTCLFLNSWTISEICKKQPLSFGVNCSLICHCLEDVCDARTDGVGCKSGSCSPGYTGFPYCQQACITGKFGINCGSDCMCEPLNVCEATNGNCIGNNKCNPLRFGPGCQNVRARLLTSPIVTTDCAAFEIFWPGVSRGPYTGSSSIVRYSVFYKSTSSKLLELEEHIPEVNRTTYNVTFSPTDRTEAYSFGIRPDFRVSIPPDYYTEHGVLSELSPFQTVECPALADFLTTVTGKRVVVNWKPYNISTVKQVKILYRLRGIGDCESLTNSEPILVTNVVDVNALVSSQELDYWRHYSIEAFGVTAHGTKTASRWVTVTTAVGVPLGAPMNLHLANDPSETEALVTWAEPPCEQRQGSLRRYILDLEPSSGVTMTTNSPNDNRPPLVLSGLSPRTTYTLSVAYATEAGTGPKGVITFRTKSAAYPASIRLISLRPASTIVAWDAPEDGHGYGNLTGYQINYWPSGSLNQLQTARVPPSQTHLELNRLRESTNYELQLFSLFGSQHFGSPVVPFRTLAVDVVNVSLALHVLQRTSSSIKVTWTTEGTPTNTFENYVLSVSMKQSLLASVPRFDRLERTISTDASRQYTFQELPASSEYEITIKRESSSVPSEDTVLAWTCPAPFSQSRNLQSGPFELIGRTNYTATVRFPTVQGYEGGPLNAFYLIVSPTSPNLSATPDEQMSALFSATTLPRTSMIAHHSKGWPVEPIVIGSGNVSLDIAHPGSQDDFSLPYGNPPLDSNTSYVVFAVVQSVVNGSTEQAVVGTMVLPTQNPTQGAHSLIGRASESTSAIVGGVLGVLFLLALLFALIVLIHSKGWCKLGRKHGNYSLRKYPMDFPVATMGSPRLEQSHLLPKSHAWWSVPVDVREPRYLIVDPEHGPTSTLVGTWSKHDLAETFAREFASIPVGYKYPHSVGNSKENLVKNRSQTVLPYNHNRVVLKRAANSTDTDYINASFIDGYMRRRAYIAAQSPFDTPTASDFWLMIYQRNCTQIVMLTNLVEDGTLKCCQYWPDPPRHTDTRIDSSQSNCSQRFGDLLVQSTDIVPYAHFTVRQFRLTDVVTGVSQNVTQYQYHSWITPDENTTGCRSNGAVGSKLFASGDEQLDRNQFNAPLSNFFINSSNIGGEFDHLAFIEFYYRIKTASRPEDGPLLVHCGTGLSRTGLYIAFDSLLQQATHERVVGVARFCAALCKSRANMLHSARHYMLLYDLLFEALVAGHSIVDLDVLSTYRLLNQKNPKLGRSYMWEQWSLLHQYTPSPDPDLDLRTALAGTNAHRNRFAKRYDLLAAERWRPHFRTQLNSPDWTGYINAVYLDGTALRDDLIVTQTPCEHTMDEFWLLIDEEKISCVVDMEPFGYGTLDAVRYWPLRTGEERNQPLFEKSSIEEHELSAGQSEADGSMSVRSPWYPCAGGRIQVCQLGPLTRVPLEPGTRKRGSVHGIYRRRLLVRPQNNAGSREKPRSREILIFHFACDWNIVNQVPESRVSLVRLLEAVRLERGTGPLLVHCLDGATRSGLFAVSHLLTERMTRDHYVDLFHVIKAVKLRRRAVISSQEQLRFVYRLLAQWIKQTLAEPLLAWTARHTQNGGAAPGSTRNWQWPQLIGHLPPYARVGIFTHSQLPALVADQSSSNVAAANETVDLATGSCPMLNTSNSITEQCASNTVTGNAMCLVPTLYRYFHDELLNQRSTYSLKFGHPVYPGAAGDLSEMNSWSAPSLENFHP